MEITKGLEALAKHQNSGAPIIFADCQIVFGDNYNPQNEMFSHFGTKR